MSEVHPSDVGDGSKPLRSFLDANLDHAYAVLDGGKFDDFAAACGAAGVFARSLFLAEAGHAVANAGPWLAPLLGRKAVDNVLRLVDGRSAAVFWICAAGEPALFRHLRTLYQALIPAWAADGKPGPDGSGRDPVRVTFRHWDPDVLGALMPVLDAEQFARVLGPADQVLFETVDFGRLRRVVADGSVVAPHGPLRITTEQAIELTDRRTAASDRRVMGILREAAPEETASRSDAEMLAEVVRLRQSGQAMGLQTEPAQAWWSYLQLTTNGAFGRGPKLQAYLQHGPGTADERMMQVKDGMLLLARSDKPAA